MPIAVEQDVRQRLAAHRIGDEHRHDVARAGHDRQIGGGKPPLQRARALLMALALDVARFQMPDGGERAGRDGGRQRGREDEARRVGADRIA